MEKKWRAMNFDEKKKGGIGNRPRMQNKEDEYSQRVWLSEAATAEGWKDLSLILWW